MMGIVTGADEKFPFTESTANLKYVREPPGIERSTSRNQNCTFVRQ
jgi:hypothetical protein